MERLKLLRAAINNAEVYDDPVAALMAEFNQQYMLVNENGKAVIYSPKQDPMRNRRYYERIFVDSFNHMYENRLIEIGRTKNGPQLEPASKVWRQHPNRRQYLGGMVFDPTGTQRDGVLNLWTGFAVQPKPGSWNLLREHIWNIICSGNDEYFWYLMNWMARMVQFPAQQGEVAVVLRSDKEGTGKGTLANTLRHLLGQHQMSVSNPAHLVGRFNLHLRDCVYLFVDEGLFAGDKAHVGVLKSLITEDTLTIEGKGMTIVQAPNHLHLMLASNEKWVVPAGLSDRRFFVLEVSDARVGDFAYFKAIWRELEHGGYEAMLHDLLTLNLSQFDVRKVPQTEGLAAQKQESLDLDYRWWQDVLMRGYVFESKMGLEDEFQHWYDNVSTDLLFASYESFAQKHHHRHPLNRITFGRFLTQKLGLKGCKPGRLMIGEHIADQGSGSRAPEVMVGRKPGYTLGSLDDRRDEHRDMLKLKIDWPTTDIDADNDDPLTHDGRQPFHNGRHRVVH